MKDLIMSITTITHTDTNTLAAVKTDSTAKAFTLLDAFVTKCGSARTELIEGLRAAGFDTVEACRPIVIQWASVKCGAGMEGFTASKSGKIMLNSAHERYEAIKTTVRDVMLMLEGKTRRMAAKKANAGKAEADDSDASPETSEKKDHVAVLAAAILKLNADDRARLMAMMQSDAPF